MSRQMAPFALDTFGWYTLLMKRIFGGTKGYWSSAAQRRALAKVRRAWRPPAPSARQAGRAGGRQRRTAVRLRTNLDVHHEVAILVRRISWACGVSVN